MLDWLACFAFNWFQQDLCLQLNIQCRRNSANMVSEEFAAKSFFPICPEIKKMDSRRLMYFGNPSRSGLPTVRFDGTTIQSSAVKRTLRKKNSSMPDQKYQENLFRLSFTPDFNELLQRLTLHTEGSDFQLGSSTGCAMHLGWTWAFKTFLLYCHKA